MCGQYRSVPDSTIFRFQSVVICIESFNGYMAGKKEGERSIKTHGTDEVQPIGTQKNVYEYSIAENIWKAHL